MKKSPGATNTRRFCEILAGTAVQLATMLSSQENYSTVHGACIGVIFIPFFLGGSYEHLLLWQEVDLF